MNARRRAVGVLVKSTDVVTECDLAVLCPAPFRLHHARLALHPGESFDAMLPRLDLACADIKDARPEAVAFACASATFAGGEALERMVAERIEAKTGCPAVTAAGVIVDAVLKVGMRRPLLVSPYGEPIDGALGRTLAGKGVEVACVLGVQPRDIFREEFLERFGGTGNRLIDPAWLPEMIAAALRDARGVDGIVISCTGLRVSEAIAAIEADTGLPVVAANQAIAASLRWRLGLEAPVAGFGRLLERADGG